MPTISTKQATKSAALKTVLEWLRTGIPQRGNPVITLKMLTLRSLFRESELIQEDAVFFIEEMKHRHLIRSAVFTGTKQDRDFGQFLVDYWTWDESEYIAEKLRRDHSIHRTYARSQFLSVQKYWVQAFSGKTLGGLTRDDIEDFIKTFEPMQVSATRKNQILKAGLVPLKWAYKKRLIDDNIGAGLTMFSGEDAERAILTPEIAKSLFTQIWIDERARLANMLAMVTGMRAGEIQGLRVQDMGNDCIYVRHSWNYQDGLKPPENNKSRTVEVPFPYLIRELMDLASRNPHGCNMDSYIFWSKAMAEKPMENNLFIQALRDAIIKTGINEKEAVKFTFHGWRHYFTAYMKDKVCSAITICSLERSITVIEEKRAKSPVIRSWKSWGIQLSALVLFCIAGVGTTMTIPLPPSPL
ncbi:MAG: site-specific integrase [Treponema sp.]|nr:site-specific integrase [Treponema sp.]